MASLIHVGKTHNRVDSGLATPEVARNQLRSSGSLYASPLLNTSGEESVIQHEAVVGDLSPPLELVQQVSMPKRNRKTEEHWQQMQKILDRQSKDSSQCEQSSDLYDVI